MGCRILELLYGANHYIRTNKSAPLYLNSMFYHSSKDALNLQWYQDEFPKVKELTHLLANVDAVNGKLVDVNNNSTIFDEDIEREMCTFKSLVRVFVGSPFVQHKMKHILKSFTTDTNHEFFTPFSKATEREPLVVDSLAKVGNFLNVSAQQRKLVRLRVCSQVTQHRIWIGALKEVLNGFAVDLDCLSSRGLNDECALLGGQIAHSCLKFLTEINVFSDPESSSWMKLSPSKAVDSSESRKWEDILLMFNDLVGCCRNEKRLKMNVAKAEIMKEGLLHIRDVLVDNSIGYKEAQHQESLVKKKLSKMLGHSSRCLFTLLLYYLYRRVADVEVDMCGGVYANGSDGKFCLFMGRILTSDSEKMVGRGVKQLDQALGIFKFVWEMAEMKGHLDLQGHMWCVGADNRMLSCQWQLKFTFCLERHGEFSTGENAWAADYISQLDAQTSHVQPRHCDTNGDYNTSKPSLEVCEGEEGHISQAQETLEIKNQEDNMKSDSEEVASGIKRENVFKSCLELQDLHDMVSSLEIQNSVEESNVCCHVVDENEREIIVQSKKGDELSASGSTSSNDHRSPKSELKIQEVEKNASGEIETASGSPSVTTDNEQNDEHVDKSISHDEVDESRKPPALKDVTSEVVEARTKTSNRGDQSHLGLGFEISLCGHELKVGMGSVAAAEVFEAHRISAVDFTSSAPSLIKNQNLVIKFKERYMTWEKAAPLVLGMAVYGLDLPVEPKDAIPVEQDHALKSRDDDQGSPSSGRRWRLWPIPFRKVKTFEHTNINSSNEEVFLDSESGSFVDATPTSSTQGSPCKQFLRTNVPTNEQIASLNLKDGQNLITFSFSTRVLGTQQVDAHIYLWKWNARIVISDVDGTITKSDVLGQFMPLVGKDWTQSGVARLFCAIKENGYQLLFLSARAIVQAYLTRNFLFNLKQDGKTLPNGPVVISPDGLFPSLYREVIRRAPHEFKIACLEDIKRLFPSDYNPFYAGFGNRDTDEISYRKIGIPKGKIFIINPKGEVAISHRIGAKSYTSLHTLVNDMFPPTSLVEQEDFNSWNYWQTPLPDVD